MCIYRLALIQNNHNRTATHSLTKARSRSRKASSIHTWITMSWSSVFLVFGNLKKIAPKKIRALRARFYQNLTDFNAIYSVFLHYNPPQAIFLVFCASKTNFPLISCHFSENSPKISRIFLGQLKRFSHSSCDWSVSFSRVI